MILRSRIDLNCDLGESYGIFRIGNDELIMPHITSANIACGFHGGDPVVMARTISLAKEHGVAVGAHPGFPDLMGFGRREMQLTAFEAEHYITYQIGALQGLAKAIDAGVQHVKLHGALYNMAARDKKLSIIVADAVKTADKDLIIFAPPESAMAKASCRVGLRVACEFFADRAYNPDGSLVPRSHPKSVLHDLREIVERTVKAVKEQKVSALNGETIRMSPIHTVCLHGDTPTAAKLAEALQKGLAKAGVKPESAASFL